MNELEGMRSLLCIPSYGMLDPGAEKHARVAMMNAACRGLMWVGDASPDRMGFSSARNSAAQQLWEAEDGFADGIMWMDNDIVPDTESISKLLYVVKDHGFDFVSGVYHKRGGDYPPVFYHYNGVKKKFHIALEYPESVLFPAEGCGFGFVWTSTRMIKKIAQNESFDPTRGWFPDDRDHNGPGEDLNFCLQAMEADVQLWIHTDIQVGHQGDREVITRDHYLEAKDAPTDELAGKMESIKANWGRHETESADQE